jgi:hypothetical protein
MGGFTLYRQKAIYIYQNHADQFRFSANPETNMITLKIQPMVELSY